MCKLIKMETEVCEEQCNYLEKNEVWNEKYDKNTIIEYLKFEGTDGKFKTIQKSNNVMEKNLIKDFEDMDRCLNEDR